MSEKAANRTGKSTEMPNSPSRKRSLDIANIADKETEPIGKQPRNSSPSKQLPDGIGNQARNSSPSKQPFDGLKLADSYDSSSPSHKSKRLSRAYNKGHNVQLAIHYLDGKTKAYISQNF